MVWFDREWQSGVLTSSKVRGEVLQTNIDKVVRLNGSVERFQGLWCTELVVETDVDGGIR